MNKPEIYTKEEVAQAAWHRKAYQQNLRCRFCHQIVPYEDREFYFQTGACAGCQPKKD
jgi:hypothetical protein